MTTTKHTPGPWYATYREGRAASMYGHHVGCRLHEKSGVIAGCDSIAEVRGHTDEEARANTCLIAAALEMLEALKAIIEGGNIDKGTHYIVDIDDIRRARAIIAKAEGRTT